MHLLDSQISRALVQPTPWEWEQYQRAAAKDKPAWGALIDIGSSHRFCDDVQRSVDTEIRRCLNRRGRRMRSAPSGPAVSELARNEYYQARNLFSWMRADYRAESGGKVTAFGDKVALVSEGAVAANARSVDPNHAYSQASAPNQVAAIATSSNWNNREAAAFVAASTTRYTSTLAAAPWRFCHDGGAMSVVAAYRPTANGTFVWSEQNGGVVGASGSQQTAQANIGVQGNSLAVISSTAGSTPLGTSTYVEASMSSAGSPQWQLRVRTAVVSSGSYGNTPQNADAAPMTIGAGASNAFPFSGDIAEIIFANKVDATLRSAGQRYMLLRYAIS